MAQTSACQLAPVFLMLRDLIGKDRMGECTSAVIKSDSGDFNQPTTRGMLTFRPSDLIVAFSDGQTTWLYGPNGLESRPTGTRLRLGEHRDDCGGGRGRDRGRDDDVDVLGVAGSCRPVRPPPVATATPDVLSTLPIRVDGDDSTTTRPFELTGGDYAVGWEIERQRGKTSCYVGSRTAPVRRSEPWRAGPAHDAQHRERPHSLGRGSAVQRAPWPVRLRREHDRL